MPIPIDISLNCVDFHPGSIGDRVVIPEHKPTLVAGKSVCPTVVSDLESQTRSQGSGFDPRFDNHLGVSLTALHMESDCSQSLALTPSRPFLYWMLRYM